MCVQARPARRREVSRGCLPCCCLRAGPGYPWLGCLRWGWGEQRGKERADSTPAVLAQGNGGRDAGPRDRSNTGEAVSSPSQAFRAPPVPRPRSSSSRSSSTIAQRGSQTTTGSRRSARRTAGADPRHLRSQPRSNIECPKWCVADWVLRGGRQLMRVLGPVRAAHIRSEAFPRRDCR